MGLAVAGERQPQRLLGAGLADRAGDGDDLRRASARARARARSRKPSSTSGTTSSGASAGTLPRWSAATTASPAPALSAAATKSWPSRLSPLMAKNASPGAMVRVSIEMPGTDGGRRIARAWRASRPPSPSTVQSGDRSCHLPRKRGRDRLVVAERQHPFADDLAGFMALAGDQQHVAALQLRDRRRGSPRARSPISIAPGAAGRIAARIAAGSSLRGLSSVTMTRSAFSRRDRAHHRPLAGVAVAAAAEHHDEPARARRAAAPRAPWRARRACGRSRRRSARRCCSPTSSSRPLAPLSCASAANTRRRLAAGRDGKAGRDQRVLDLEGADQRQAHRVVAARHARA